MFKKHSKKSKICWSTQTTFLDELLTSAKKDLRNLWKCSLGFMFIKKKNLSVTWCHELHVLYEFITVWLIIYKPLSCWSVMESQSPLRPFAHIQEDDFNSCVRNLQCCVSVCCQHIVGFTNPLSVVRIVPVEGKVKGQRGAGGAGCLGIFMNKG